MANLSTLIHLKCTGSRELFSSKFDFSAIHKLKYPSEPRNRHIFPKIYCSIDTVLTQRRNRSKVQPSSAVLRRQIQKASQLLAQLVEHCSDIVVVLCFANSHTSLISFQAYFRFSLSWVHKCYHLQLKPILASLPSAYLSYRTVKWVPA